MYVTMVTKMLYRVYVHNQDVIELSADKNSEEPVPLG